MHIRNIYPTFVYTHRPDGSRPTKEEFIAHMEAARRSPGMSLREFKRHMDKWIEKKLSR